MGHWCFWTGCVAVFLARLVCAKAAGIRAPHPHISTIQSQVISSLQHRDYGTAAIIGRSTLRGIVSLRTFFRLFTHIQMMPILESGEETLVGGQAVIEGVMMRAPHSYCVAVRKPSGEIVTEEKPLARMSERYRIFKYPVVRGVGTLYQAMALGLRALKFSANSVLESEAPKAAPKEIPTWAISVNMLVSFGFFIFLYKFVPL